MFSEDSHPRICFVAIVSKSAPRQRFKDSTMVIDMKLETLTKCNVAVPLTKSLYFVNVAEEFLKERDSGALW